MTPPLTPEQVQRAQALLAPIQLEKQEGESYFLTATLRYASALLAARFEVTQGGVVRMLEDRELAADLPETTGLHTAPAWG